MGALSDDHLSEFLWHSARTRDGQGEWQHRAAASAGGIHPIHLILFRHRSNEAELYDPVRHRLLLLASTDRNALRAAVEAAFFVAPAREATLILLAAERSKTAESYEHEVSLVWRDAGALLATMQLVSTWLTLATCPLGPCGDALVTACHADGHLTAAGLLIVGAPVEMP